MKKILCLIILIGFLGSMGSPGEAAKKKKKKGLEKRVLYDLFGESLNTRYVIFRFTDINGVTGGSSDIDAEGDFGWTGVENVIKYIYRDKYKKMKAEFKLGFYYYYDAWRGNEILDVTLTPFTIKRTWLPAFMGTLKTKKHNAMFLFTRTSGMFWYWSYPPVGETTNAQEPTSTKEVSYLVGLKDTYKFKWEDIKLDITGVYLHNWKDCGLIYEKSYFGNINTTNAPTSITLKFSDDSTEDGKGAKLYSLRYSVDDEPYKDISPGAPQEASGAIPFKIAITDAEIATAKSVRIEMELANDYKVEIKTDKLTSYTTILRAPGNIQNESNRKTITYQYGLSSASDMFGFTVDGKVYGTEVEAECIFNNQYRKYPADVGKRAFDIYPVFCVKAEREIDFTGFDWLDDNLVIGGDYFYTHPSFSSPTWDGKNTFGPTKVGTTKPSTFYYLDDNDDRDYYYSIGGEEQLGMGGIMAPYRNPAASRRPYSRPKYSRFYDRDCNGNPNSNYEVDWEQDLYLFTTDPPRFWMGKDRNNNIIADEHEDDTDLDYPYDLDRQGYGIYGIYSLFKGMKLTGGYDDFGEAFGTKKTVNLYLTSEYTSKVRDMGNITLHHTIKKVQDDIPDNQVAVPGDMSLGNDDCHFKDSLLNVLYVESEYTGFKGVTVSNKFRFDNNYQYRDTRNVKWAGFITNAKYEYKATKRLSIIPQWKCWIEKGASTPYYSSYVVDKNLNAFLLKAKFKLFDKTNITGGVQYKLVREPASPSSEYNRLTYVFQIISKAGSYPLQMGYVKYFTSYLHDLSSNATEDTIFIRLYVV